MGYDKTPSSDKRIFALGVATIVTLGATMPLLRSYYFSVMEPMQQQRVTQTGHRELDAYRAEQTRGTANVGTAIQSFGDRGRVASGSIAPRRSDDANLAAVEGWVQLKDEDARRAAQIAFDRAAAARAAQDAANADGGVPAVPPAAPVPAAPAPTAPGAP